MELVSDSNQNFMVNVISRVHGLRKWETERERRGRRSSSVGKLKKAFVGHLPISSFASF
jgi:hypothetical protein